jgi:catechol 2,3-dioxygenase-like lactoylglutathione lyase family enzyme
MLHRPHHVNYVVSDLDRSIPYYRDTLDLKLIQDAMRENLPSYDRLMAEEGVRLRVALFQLPNSPLLLELFQFFHPETIRQQVGYHGLGSSHLAYEVQDLAALHRRLLEGGHRVISPPTDIVRDEKLLGSGMYALDPDGIVLEMFEPNETGRREVPASKPAQG